MQSASALHHSRLVSVCRQGCICISRLNLSRCAYSASRTCALLLRGSKTWHTTSSCHRTFHCSLPSLAKFLSISASGPMRSEVAPTPLLVQRSRQKALGHLPHPCSHQLIQPFTPRVRGRRRSTAHRFHACEDFTPHVDAAPCRRMHFNCQYIAGKAICRIVPTR